MAPFPPQEGPIHVTRRSRATGRTTSLATMARLLVVHHSPTPPCGADRRGASPARTTTRSRASRSWCGRRWRRPPTTCSPPTATCSARPRTSATCRGALKHFFDTIFLEAGGALTDDGSARRAGRRQEAVRPVGARPLRHDRRGPLGAVDRRRARRGARPPRCWRCSATSATTQRGGGVRAGRDAGRPAGRRDLTPGDTMRTSVARPRRVLRCPSLRVRATLAPAPAPLLLAALAAGVDAALACTRRTTARAATSTRTQVDAVEAARAGRLPGPERPRTSPSRATRRKTVDCTEPHTAETYAVGDAARLLPATRRTTTRSSAAWAYQTCSSRSS